MRVYDFVPKEYQKIFSQVPGFDLIEVDYPAGKRCLELIFMAIALDKKLYDTNCRGLWECLARYCKGLCVDC